MAAVQQAHAMCADCGGMIACAGALTACRPQLQQQHSVVGEGGVEADPTRRYIRYPVLLGRGACKRVYKAFDLQEGIEVAWNKAELLGQHMDAEAQERLFGEIRVLLSLKHRNIITCHDWWHDAHSQTLNFITELFTSGTLRQYRKRHMGLISETAIKRWAFQILEGLLYLHAHSPPIMHRDLKCDNILVNGTSGQVKIADLGLASCQRGMSVVGTPEFMAPEMYDEAYDEKVDIYAFGMCMLELATLEYPYSECSSVPAIFRRVSQGIPPAALAKVTRPVLRGLITTCIAHDPTQRPGALQLLRNPFFADLAEPSHVVAASKPASGCFSPPFGSCGNLMALSHGTIPHHLPHGSSRHHSHAYAAHASDPDRRDSSSNSSSASSSASSTGALGVARDVAAAAATGAAAAAPVCSAAGIGDGVLQQQQQGDRHSAAPADHGAVTGSTVAGSGTSGVLQQQQQAQGDAPSDAAAACEKAAAAAVQDKPDVVCISSPVASTSGLGAVGAAAPAAVGFARGTTVCVAAMGRSEGAEAGQDSDDDEVLVALEDVLVPHPGHLMDADTYGLTAQLTHAASGCTILSGPGCELGEVLTGLLGGTWTPDDPEGRRLSSGLLPGLSSAAGTQGQQQQHQQLCGGGGGGSSSACGCRDGGISSSRPHSGGSRPPSGGSRLGSSSGSSSSSASLLAARELQAQAGGPCSIGTAAGMVQGQAAAAAAAQQPASPSPFTSGPATPRQSSCSDTACMPVRRASACGPGTAAAAAAAAGAFGGSTAASTAAAHQLLRMISSGLGSASSGAAAHAHVGARQVAGALAAAGLLQLSPGCFIPTPPLLEKLLSRAGGPRGPSSTATATGITAGSSSSSSMGAAPQDAGPHGAAGAARSSSSASSSASSTRARHARFNSSEGIGMPSIREAGVQPLAGTHPLEGAAAAAAPAAAAAAAAGVCQQAAGQAPGPGHPHFARLCSCGGGDGGGGGGGDVPAVNALGGAVAAACTSAGLPAAPAPAATTALAPADRQSAAVTAPGAVAACTAPAPAPAAAAAAAALVGQHHHTTAGHRGGPEDTPAVACGGQGAAAAPGFGRILVRRRFVRNLAPPTANDAQQFRRTNTL